MRATHWGWNHFIFSGISAVSCSLQLQLSGSSWQRALHILCVPSANMATGLQSQFDLVCAHAALAAFSLNRLTDLRPAWFTYHTAARGQWNGQLGCNTFISQRSSVDLAHCAAADPFYTDCCPHMQRMPRWVWTTIITG